MFFSTANVKRTFPIQLTCRQDLALHIRLTSHIKLAPSSLSQYDGLASTIGALLSSGLSGFSFSHSDVGGYTSLSKYDVEVCTPGCFMTYKYDIEVHLDASYLPVPRYLLLPPVRHVLLLLCGTCPSSLFLNSDLLWQLWPYGSSHHLRYRWLTMVALTYYGSSGPLLYFPPIQATLNLL